MKINLLINSTNVRKGFINVDPFATPNDGKLRGNVGNLDGIVDDAECEVLVCDDVLDFIPQDVSGDVLVNWIKKLRHGGTITIGGVDLREVSLAFSRQEIDLQSANILIYGNQRLPVSYRKSSSTIQHVIGLLKSRGLDILDKKVDSCFYSVTARRP